jgi:hypothetical protein
VKKLKDSSLDLLVVSGGSLEQPKIAGLDLEHEGEDAPRESTVAVLESLERGELDVIGLGRPIITDPEVPKRIVSGENDRAPSPEAALHPFHLLPWNNMQLERLAEGLDPDLLLDGADAVEQFTEFGTRNITALLQHRA